MNLSIPDPPCDPPEDIWDICPRCDERVLAEDTDDNGLCPLCAIDCDEEE